VGTVVVAPLIPRGRETDRAERAERPDETKESAPAKESDEERDMVESR